MKRVFPKEHAESVMSPYRGFMRGELTRTPEVICMTLVLGLLLATSALADDGTPAYLNGLDRLESGAFAEAEKLFASAIEVNDENADFRIALGVAQTLGEKLPQAEKTLARAVKLSNNSVEARLWLSTAIAMQGDFTRGTEIYPFAIARNEYVNTIRRMSHEYGQGASAMATAQRNGNHEADLAYAKQELAKRDGLRKRFPGFGAAFAANMKSKLPAGNVKRPDGGAGGSSESAPVAAALIDRIKASIQQREYTAAMRDLRPLLSGNPNDLQLVFFHGLCQLNLGAPEIARREFTRALYARPLDGDLYALRAIAAAKTGDRRRADADLAVARSLQSARSEAAEQAIASTPHADGDPAAMLTAMYHSVEAGESYDRLIESATALIIARNATRRRADETYVDLLREHERGAAAEPRNADRLAAFAAFLYDNAVSPRGEAVELRATWRPYRPADEAMLEAELSRALALANDALAIDANSLSAMITKAAVLVKRMQLGDAEQFLKSALDKAPTEPRLLRLFAEVADRAAAAKQAQAYALRAPTTWEDSLYIYTRYPSASERAQADALEAQANRLWAMARLALQQAIAGAKTPAEAAYFQAVLDRREGNADSALASARRAVDLDPNSAENLDMLTTLLASSGQRTEALLTQARAANLMHTTAGPALKCVWFSLPRTKFKTSREFLVQAAQYDAADPRVAAYYGAVAGADDKIGAAAAWYAVACALYEANARFQGVSVSSKEPSPLRTGVAVTMMNVNLRAARLLKSSRPADAETLLRANLAMQPRIVAAQLFTPVPASMLPDVDADQIPVPPADHAGFLLAVSRFELGRLLLARNRPDDAIVELEKVAAYRDMVPPTVDAGSQMQQPPRAAGVYIISALLKKGDLAAATERFKYIGRGRMIDPETDAELARITQIINQQRAENQQRMDEEALQKQRDAYDAARREREQQLQEADRRRRAPRGPGG